MKTTTITKAIAILFLTTLTTSCMIDGFNRISGNRNVVTENRKINSDFTKIEVGQGIDLFITQSNQAKLVIEADENLHKYITTEVVNGVLKIHSKRNIWRAKAKKVYLNAQHIESIKATSGSDVITENTINTKIFDISTSSGADAKINVHAETVTSSASSGSDLKIYGKATNHTSIASSGANINAYQLESKNTIVRVSSGADINIFASESLNAKASSGGDIDYKGNPKKITVKTSSGGDISAH